MEGLAQDLTLTSFFQGRLKVYQPKKGYRFGIDALLLGHFLRLKPEEKALEVGAGSGIVSLMAALKYPKAKLWALEVDPVFVSCLKKNLQENQLKNPVFLVKGDILKSPFKQERFDVVFSNPPYFKVGCGRQSPDPLKNLAKREIGLSLKNFLKNVARLLKNRGRLYLIFTALRTAELISALKETRLEPKTLRFVHSYPGDNARFVLVEAVKLAGEETLVLPPLFIYEKRKGVYTQEVKAMLEGF
ncbi:methyltransferase [Thermodesulfobacterium sp. TA1]|uniref:tRNA1(Val) (adenine(37)-N6)-methyltransferase n=1 Tax=Thermodesulfobacterium sp. TA1 TaxID=2234087 RepID=UPI001232067A|nr:methyltransferase [Thermodesulfobacterium sp. TA1]QER42453.1 methyltransferase [Thermodesulfobacterium sp. TA1]